MSDDLTPLTVEFIGGPFDGESRALDRTQPGWGRFPVSFHEHSTGRIYEGVYVVDATRRSALWHPKGGV